MALARRRLAREIRRLVRGPDAGSALREVSAESERLAALARSMLGPLAKEALPAVEEPPTPEHRLVMQGHAGWLQIPDLIASLGTDRRSGILRVKMVSEVFTIEYHGGYIVHCESTRPSSGQRLGDILVAQGAVDRRALEAELSTPSGERLGARMLQKGLVTSHQLETALKTQIQVLFCHMAREMAERFSFWIGPPQFVESGIRMSAISLLLEGARVNDEFADGLRVLEDR